MSNHRPDPQPPAPPPRSTDAELAARIVDSSVDGILAFDLDLRYTLWNAAMERISGVPRDQVVGRRAPDVFPFLVETGELDYFRAALDGKAVRSLDRPYHVDQSGRQGWFEGYYSPLYGNDGGRVIGGVAVIRDISERKAVEETRRIRASEAEAALRLSEQRFNKLVELSPHSTQIYTPDGTPIMGNPAWERLFGVTHADIAGYNVLRDPVLVELGVMPFIQRGFAGEPVIVPVIPYRPYTGIYKDQERWCGAVIYPVKDDTGRIEHVIVTHEDVTERKAAEDALRRAHDRLRLALDGARMGDWVWDAATDNLSMSDRACAIYGVPPGAAVTREQVRTRLHPDDRERARAASARAIADRTTYDIEYRVLRPGGAVTWVAARGVAQYDPDGRVTGMLGVAVDVTPRKLIEQERDRLLESERAARAEAEHASRMKDEFLATLSHELRTPLNAILGFAQLLSSGVIGPDELAHAVEVIERNARAQRQIIEDLLDMSRIISGKIQLDVRPVNVADVIAAAVETVTPSADAKVIRFHRVIEPDAGPVTADPGRLQQVFWNLLTNAIKFTPKGGRVQVVCARVNSHVEVTVSDTGAGIKPDFLPFVFERFRQGDASTARRYGGLGLGLAIVKSLVELHGGTIAAHSPGEGRGATFVMTLPLAPVQALGDRDGDPARRPYADAADPANLDDFRADLRGVTVLVLDDEPDARELVRRLLAGCDADVLTAASAAEALPLVPARRPHVVISDIGMPDVDGYEFVRRLRALGPEQGGGAPAVALTAFARSEDRTRSILAGYQMHLAKPVEPAELIAVVASLAGRTG